MLNYQRVKTGMLLASATFEEHQLSRRHLLGEPPTGSHTEHGILSTRVGRSDGAIEGKDPKRLPTLKGEAKLRRHPRGINH